MLRRVIWRCPRCSQLHRVQTTDTRLGKLGATAWLTCVACGQEAEVERNTEESIKWTGRTER
jgi:transcription elongation factor Elf1